MISVVIPLFNKSHCIARTLKSVSSQSFQDFEIIIIDDGSSDDGVQKIREMNNPKIKIYQQENRGVSVARNEGVMYSNYEYIAFLDADDEWLPEYLETMKSAIDQFPEAGMFCCAGLVRNNMGTYSRIAKKYEKQIVRINYFENPHVYTHTSATIVKKSVFNKTQGFPVGMRLNQDFASFFSIAFISPVVYCGFKLSIYVGDVEGQTTQRSEERRFNKYKYIIDRINLCHDNWQRSAAKDSLYLVFEKYELRIFFLGLLREKDYEGLKLFLDSLSDDIINGFQKIELWLYSTKLLRLFGIMNIYYTKVLWRSKGFPRISYKNPE